jgi:hypothetical protein
MLKMRDVFRLLLVTHPASITKDSQYTFADACKRSDPFRNEQNGCTCPTRCRLQAERKTIMVTYHWWLQGKHGVSLERHAGIITCKCKGVHRPLGRLLHISSTVMWQHHGPGGREACSTYSHRHPSAIADDGGHLLRYPKHTLINLKTVC